jgi:hypothetical protein
MAKKNIHTDADYIRQTSEEAIGLATNLEKQREALNADSVNIRLNEIADEMKAYRSNYSEPEYDERHADVQNDADVVRSRMEELRLIQKETHELVEDAKAHVIRNVDLMRKNDLITENKASSYRKAIEDISSLRDVYRKEESILEDIKSDMGDHLFLTYQNVVQKNLQLIYGNKTQEEIDETPLGQKFKEEYNQLQGGLRTVGGLMLPFKSLKEGIDAMATESREEVKKYKKEHNQRQKGDKIMSSKMVRDYEAASELEEKKQDASDYAQNINMNGVLSYEEFQQIQKTIEKAKTPNALDKIMDDLMKREQEFHTAKEPEEVKFEDVEINQENPADFKTSSKKEPEVQEKEAENPKPVEDEQKVSDLVLAENIIDYEIADNLEAKRKIALEYKTNIWMNGVLKDKENARFEKDINELKTQKELDVLMARLVRRDKIFTEEKKAAIQKHTDMQEKAFEQTEPDKPAEPAEAKAAEKGDSFAGYLSVLKDDVYNKINEMNAIGISADMQQGIYNQIENLHTTTDWQQFHDNIITPMWNDTMQTWAQESAEIDAKVEAELAKIHEQSEDVRQTIETGEKDAANIVNVLKNYGLGDDQIRKMAEDIHAFYGEAKQTVNHIEEQAGKKPEMTDRAMEVLASIKEHIDNTRAFVRAIPLAIREAKTTMVEKNRENMNKAFEKIQLHVADGLFQARENIRACANDFDRDKRALCDHRIASVKEHAAKRVLKESRKNIMLDLVSGRQPSIKMSYTDKELQKINFARKEAVESIGKIASRTSRSLKEKVEYDIRHEARDENGELMTRKDLYAKHLAELVKDSGKEDISVGYMVGSTFVGLKDATEEQIAEARPVIFSTNELENREMLEMAGIQTCGRTEAERMYTELAYNSGYEYDIAKQYKLEHDLEQEMQEQFAEEVQNIKNAPILPDATEDQTNEDFENDMEDEELGYA